VLVDERLRAARRVAALLEKHAVPVAVERLRLLLVRVARGRGFGDLRTERALRFALGGRPVEPVVLAGGAEDLAREDARFPVVRRGLVLALRVDVGVQRRERRDLVPPDAAIGDLVDPRLDVEAPGSVLAHERDREGPAFVAEERDAQIGKCSSKASFSRMNCWTRCASSRSATSSPDWSISGPSAPSSRRARASSCVPIVSASSCIAASGVGKPAGSVLLQELPAPSASASRKQDRVGRSS
jgi:hypothetical protein